MFARTLTASSLVASVSAHGAVTFPPPRNAIDSDELPWKAPVPTRVPFEPWCPFPSAEASGVDPGRNLTGANGQACFWFSNGCAIGCQSCDGSTRGPIPGFSGGGKGPLVPVPGHIDSGTGKPVQKEPICAPSQSLNATVCDPAQRTVNTGAECGSADDFYYYSPWRRPGSAPVIDSCGIAGGRIPGQGAGGYGAQYQNTTHAKIGDLGSSLPHVPSGVTWKAGDVVEVAWTLQANHGGGYSYRLCPLGSQLDEDCFKQTPLDFVGTSAFRWGGRGGIVHEFNATYVTEGTSPEGSMWAMNPVPRAWKNLTTGEWAGNYAQTGEGFQPRCPWDEGDQNCVGMWGPYNMEIVDNVKIPDNLPAGPYVLGWRWDCEESNQIWASCSDISVVV